MDHSKIERIRARAQQMRRAASMSHNAEIQDMLMKAAAEAEADAAEMEAELDRPEQRLPPQP